MGSGSGSHSSFGLAVFSALKIFSFHVAHLDSGLPYGVTCYTCAYMSDASTLGSVVENAKFCMFQRFTEIFVFGSE